VLLPRPMQKSTAGQVGKIRAQNLTNPVKHVAMDSSLRVSDATSHVSESIRPMTAPESALLHTEADSKIDSRHQLEVRLEEFYREVGTRTSAPVSSPPAYMRSVTSPPSAGRSTLHRRGRFR
jgi:hypothetical protein